MRVRILSIDLVDASHVYVTCVADAGSLGARWTSRRPPRVGDVHSVEIDFLEDVAAQLSAETSTSMTIASAAPIVHFRALVESVDDDGVACLRISPDGIVLARAQATLVAGTTIELSLPRESIALTPVGSPL